MRKMEAKMKETNLGVDDNSVNSERRTLKDVEKEMEELKTIIKEQESRLQNLQSSAFQLANFYFVFQGVILTAICNGNTSLKCKDAWFLIILSLFAATLNLIALSKIGMKYMKTIAQHDKNWCDYNNHESERQRIQQSSSTHSQEETHHQHVKDDNFKNSWQKTMTIQTDDPYKEYKRKTVFAVCMVLFTGFAAVTLYGCRRIICRHDHDLLNNLGPTGNDNCVNLCDGRGKCINFCSQC